MNDLTQQGVVALKSGNKIRARNLLKASLRQDPRDVDAWLWLSGAVETDDERVECLQNVLRLDPSNRFAARGYSQLTGQEWVVEQPPAQAAVPPPAMLPMSEGAPPAALDQLQPAAEALTPSPVEEPEVNEAILREYPELKEEPAAGEMAVEAVETAAEGTAADVEETLAAGPGQFEAELPPAEPVAELVAEPVVEAEPEIEEPRIKSWEELLGPSEADELPAEPEERSLLEEVTDTQELRIGAPGSGLLFVTGPSLGYAILKLIILLVIFAGAAALAYFFLPQNLQQYVIIGAAALAVLWLALFLSALLGSTSTRYTLTKNKLLLEGGPFGRKKTGLELTEIEDVQYSRSALQKIGGVGDLLVKVRADGSILRLRDVGRFSERLHELENAIL